MKTIVQGVIKIAFALALLADAAFAQPTPPGGGGANGSGGGGGVPFNSPQYTTNDFWIEALPPGTNIYNSAPNTTTLLLYSTSQNIPYEIQYTTNLADPNWTTLGTHVGAANSDFTPIICPAIQASNVFFRAFNYTLDTDQTGIPDWWQLKYFGHVGIDPNGDPMNDGYSNLYKYLNGMNPNVAYQPPTPTGLSVSLNSGGTTTTLRWNPSSGPVLEYVISRADPTFDTNGFYDGMSSFQTIGTTTDTSFIDTGAFTSGDPLNAFGYASQYAVSAVYPGNNSSSAASYSFFGSTPSPACAVNANLVRGPFGRYELAFSPIPPGVQSILITWAGYDYFYDIADGTLGTNIISVSDIVNGCYVIPDDVITNYLNTTALGQYDQGYGSPLAWLYMYQTYGYNAYVQGISSNGVTGPLAYAGNVNLDEACLLDGREHLQSTLAFLLQAATLTQPNPAAQGAFPPSWVIYSNNYVETGFLFQTYAAKGYGSGINIVYPTFVVLDNVWPITLDYLCAQWLYSTNSLPTPQYDFATTPPNVLQQNGSYQSGPYWIQQDTSQLSDVGANQSNGGRTVSLASGIQNIYGGAVETALDVGGGYGAIDPTTGLPDWGPTEYVDLSPGGSVTTTNSISSYYSQFQMPTLHSQGFYFAPVNLAGAGLQGLNSPVQNYPLPILDGFSTTNETPLILGAVGQPMVVGGWEKLQINLTGAKYAYVGQYFDTNSHIVSNGYTYTNISAGIVSPYGEFFPTQAGTAVLSSLPATGHSNAQVQIQVLKLGLDVNHDGTIDLSYFGSDNTSSNQPMVFWANNDYDRNDSSGTNQDDFQSASNPSQGSIFSGPPMADCNYTNAYGYRAIPCTRDLEDYARLWLAGITTNLLTNLPSGSTITLSWGDVGNPNFANPTIDLFQAADADGGMGYLTNIATAANQINPNSCQFVGRLAPGGSIQLNAATFNDSWAGNHFIWCGVNYGSGGLNLTIQDANSNVLAQTTAYIQIKDIKQMYERWTSGDNQKELPGPTLPAGNDLPPGITAFQYPAPTDSNTPYILYVHGWNMKIFEKDRWAETAYKRLYWQGYQGRFGSFRWPTGNGFSGIISALTDMNNYDNSEQTAWESGQFLNDLLVNLNSEYPGNVYVLAHSMGNVVTGEALRLAGTNVIVNTYVASQAAISARAYDNTIPADAIDSYTPHVYTPDSEGHYYTDDAPPYFNGIGGAKKFVDYYNPLDFALSFWVVDQNLKADSLSYHYSTPTAQFPSGYYYAPPFTIGQSLTFPTNTYVIFAQAAQSYSLALGAETNIATTFSSNLIINLNTSPFNFGDKHIGHSLQFRNDNMTSSAYWEQLMSSFNLQQ